MPRFERTDKHLAGQTFGRTEGRVVSKDKTEGLEEHEEECEEAGPIAVCFLQRTRKNREDSRQVASSEWPKA